MARKALGRWWLFVVFGICLNAMSADRSDDSDVHQWMRGMRSDIEDLLVADPTSSAGSNGKVVAHLKTLVEQSAKKLQTTTNDPSINLIFVLMQAQLGFFERSVKSSGGSRSVRENALQTLPYCIACHTRYPGFKVESGKETDSPRLGKLLKEDSVFSANYYTSARRFDEAIARVEDGISKLKNQDGFFAWDRLVHLGLALTVRVFQDPNRTEKLIQSILKSEATPIYLRDQAIVWAKSVNEWKSEASRTPSSPAGWLAEAKRLIVLGREMNGFPKDKRGEIQLLRASVALHQAEESSEVLYELGNVYESLDHFRLWELPELYFARCVYREPGSPMAQQCFARFDQSVRQGYTGSAGEHIPSEVLARIELLRKVAYQGTDTVKVKSP